MDLPLEPRDLEVVDILTHYLPHVGEEECFNLKCICGSFYRVNVSREKFEMDFECGVCSAKYAITFGQRLHPQPQQFYTGPPDPNPYVRTAWRCHCSKTNSVATNRHDVAMELKCIDCNAHYQPGPGLRGVDVPPVTRGISSSCLEGRTRHMVLLGQGNFELKFTCFRCGINKTVVFPAGPGPA